MNPELVNLVKKEFGVTFNNQALLDQAFTHSSYVNEHRYLELTDNERLEFLGDAVLELLVSQYLYSHYPTLPEGKLTKMRAAIVREDSLSKFAKECQFDRYIRLGKGEENSNGRQRPALLCDLFESYLGALYLDQGFAAAKAFVDQVIVPKIESGAFSHEMDHKTALQEMLQRNGDVAISYQLISEEGPAHEREFCVEVSLNGEVIGTGSGKSKKNAEQQAAASAIEKIKQTEKGNK